MATEEYNPIQLNSTVHPIDARETKPVNLKSKLGNFKAYYAVNFLPRAHIVNKRCSLLEAWKGEVTNPPNPYPFRLRLGVDDGF